MIKIRKSNFCGIINRAEIYFDSQIHKKKILCVAQMYYLHRLLRLTASSELFIKIEITIVQLLGILIARGLSIYRLSKLRANISFYFSMRNKFRF